MQIERKGAYLPASCEGGGGVRGGGGQVADGRSSFDRTTALISHWDIYIYISNMGAVFHCKVPRVPGNIYPRRWSETFYTPFWVANSHHLNHPIRVI